MNMEAGPPGEPVPDQRRLVGGVVAGNQVHVQLGGHLGLDSIEKLAELQGPVAAVALANHLTGPGVQSGEEGRGAVAHVIMGAPLGLARTQGQKRPGAVQGLDLGLLVHAQDQRPVRRVEVEPHNIRTFSMKRGSADGLKVSVRWGCSAKARQMRLTVLWLRPERRAMDRVLQWVASLGVASKVNAITRSTSASSIILGRPLRGWSNRPSIRCSRNRERHFPTVSTHTRNSAATPVLLRPSAQARTILARRANAWAVLGWRVHCSKVSRSAPSRAKSAIGLPPPICIFPFAK